MVGVPGISDDPGPSRTKSSEVPGLELVRIGVCQKRKFVTGGKEDPGPNPYTDISGVIVSDVGIWEVGG